MEGEGILVRIRAPLGADGDGEAHVADIWAARIGNRDVVLLHGQQQLLRVLAVLPGRSQPH